MRFDKRSPLHILFACLVLILFSSGKEQVADAPFDTVKVEGGVVSGTKNTAGDVHIFKGIPFAAPPVEALRWRAPQKVQAWQGVKACDHFAASPMQAPPVPFSMWTKEFLIPDAPISEDCLYLNVWTAAASVKERRPVLVWIYGGGFMSGGSGVPIYDGEAMAKKGIVFVSINYRVGIFGFFAHPALSSESPAHSSGNYGILDQVAALEWVQQNIAAFGGDPSNVTIAGQSAGSMSVNCLVASPLAKGLFTKAIAQSGANFTKGNVSLKTAEAEGEKIMQSAKANSIDALRKLPAAELMGKAQGFRGPVIDGYVLPDDIVTLFKERKANKVTLLTGWNEDEGLLFGPVKNASNYKQDAIAQYGNDADKFLGYFPGENDAEAAASQLKLSRDQIFGVQNYAWANIASSRESVVYVYRFTRKVPATGEYVKYGAFHTGEVPYAYDNLRFVDRPWEAADQQLASTMSGYWANFVKTGDPNGTGLPVWERYSSADKRIMELGLQTGMKTMWDSDALDFLYLKMTEK